MKGFVWLCGSKQFEFSTAVILNQQGLTALVADKSSTNYNGLFSMFACSWTLPSQPRTPLRAGIDNENDQAT